MNPNTTNIIPAAGAKNVNMDNPKLIKNSLIGSKKFFICFFLIFKVNSFNVF
jgi:hypothetical protein